MKDAKDAKEMKGQAFSFEKPELTEGLKAFHSRLDELNLAPLWEVFGKLATAEPKPRSVPAIWRYDQIRPILMEAGDLITPEEAERRVLILENPGLRGESWITQSLFAAVQLVMPGEIAPAHRHAASAFRFMLEGDGGGYTSVDGERTMMQPGDFVLTPSWTFHDHGNLGNEPTIWMDGLDNPFIDMMGVTFTEDWPEPTYPLTKGEGDAEARYGNNLLPVEYDSDFDDEPSSAAGPAAAAAAADDPLLPADRPPVHVALPRPDEIYCGESRLNATHPQHAPQVAASTFTPANDPPWRMPAGPPPPPTTWRPPPGQPWMVWRGFRYTKCDSRFTRSGGQFVQRIMASRGLETWQLGPKGLFWLQQLWLKSQRRRITALADAARSRAGREPHAVNTEPVSRPRRA